MSEDTTLIRIISNAMCRSGSIPTMVCSFLTKTASWSRRATWYNGCARIMIRILAENGYQIERGG